MEDVKMIITFKTQVNAIFITFSNKSSRKKENLGNPNVGL